MKKRVAEDGFTEFVNDAGVVLLRVKLPDNVTPAEILTFIDHLMDIAKRNEARAKAPS